MTEIEPFGPFEDAFLIHPKRFGDDRGWFEEVWNAARFREQTGVETDFVQDNASRSKAAGTVRGLHVQSPPMAQAKLVRCPRGAIHDVIVDIRHGSPTFGKWAGVTLSEENGLQLWVPRGFAHGFATLQPDSEIAYKVDNPYSAEHDGGIFWNDPAIGIEWPFDTASAVLSDKDKAAPKLADFPRLFEYGA
ncbi:dTDP-4-dehydrorhamnose 3,5-epimerase [Hyphobacterium sp. HN65]|uniref:dTDP-4-dehydrorhamnose 3,5-epimerase n=1 Tax=Hyphobacterium lacteum TaxID=3116575 RepID=A0ABU7LQP1_9PROT|nr:dTDP-4-dehydrorhamnose 3,5-epimerase [Hyphobacterium sp. HN65]MEE2525644.1 dTDP-4-dehydrorhamnose 3,5-epimerase [Hyphobacterium sp. HN65]